MSRVRSVKSAVSKSVRIISVLALVAPAAREGYAQSTSRPPQQFHGLFGPVEAELTRPRRLDATFSLYDAQDDNTFLATDTDILDEALQANRWYSGATGSVTYVRRPPHSLLTVSGASAARYYPDLGRVVSMRHSGGVALDMYPVRDWRLQISNNASFSPFYQVVLGASAGAIWAPEAAPPADDQSVSKQHAMQYGSLVGLSHSYSDRSALAFNYGLHRTQVFGLPADSSSQRAGVLFTHALTRDIGLRIGYAYGVSSTAADPSAAPIRNNDLDLGVNYGRTFSTSTRTSFGFSTGSTIVSSEDGRHFRVTGSGRLMRRLSPLWTVQAVYDRGLQVPDGATRPFFSDTIGGSLNGYFNRRIGLRVQPNYSHGVVGLAGKTNAYDSVTSSVRLDVALTRRAAVYAEHFYYRYQFESAEGLPPLLTVGLNRQGFRMGLTLWASLVQ